MPLKAAICDDEPEQAGMLERYIKEWAVSSDIKIETRIFPSAEAFRFVWEEEKDWWLILLDIQMEGEDGVSLAKYLRGEDEKLQILFITALPDYIEEGYDVSALHYLIKPIRRDKFFQCLDKAAKKEEEESYLLLTTVQGEKVRAAQKEIMYMEAFAHTVQIHTKEEILEVRCGINTLEEQLEGKNFIRCHRSYIVGLAYTARIKKKELLLDDGTSVPVSRRLFQEVNRAFVAYYRREESGGYGAGERT